MMTIEVAPPPAPTLVESPGAFAYSPEASAAKPITISLVAEAGFVDFSSGFDADVALRTILGIERHASRCILTNGLWRKFVDPVVGEGAHQ